MQGFTRILSYVPEPPVTWVTTVLAAGGFLVISTKPGPTRKEQGKRVRRAVRFGPSTVRTALRLWRASSHRACGNLRVEASCAYLERYLEKRIYIHTRTSNDRCKFGDPDQKATITV